MLPNYEEIKKWTLFNLKILLTTKYFQYEPDYLSYNFYQNYGKKSYGMSIQAK